MDIPSPIRNQAPHQQWAGHSGWSSVSPPQSLQNPISTFQHLTLTTSHHPGSFLNGTQSSNPSWPVSSGPPCSLRLVSNGSLHPHTDVPTQIPLNNHQFVYAPVLHPLADQRLLNGPQSPIQKDSSSLFGSVDQSQSPPAAEGFAGHIHNCSLPTSPIQQQPQWDVSSSPGVIKQFVPEAVIQERTLQVW